MKHLILSILILTASLAYGSLASDLGLKLVGTIIHSDNTKSMASMSGDVFKTQDKIKNLAEVVLIERFKVQLRNIKTGQFEWIAVESFDPAKAVPSDDIFKNTRREFQVPRESIDKVTTNLTKFMNDAGTEPVTDKQGKVTGFRLNFIKKDGVFAGLGLVEGDVLSDVNGLPLNSISSAMSIYQQLRTSSLIELTVKRGDKTQKFSYQVR